MSSLLLALPVAAVAAGLAFVGIRVLRSPAAAAFGLTFTVGTNASPVLRRTFGVPEFVVPLAVLVLLAVALRRLAAGQQRRSLINWLALASVASVALLFLSAAIGPFVSSDAAASSSAVQVLVEHMAIVIALAAVCWNRPPAFRWALVGLGVAGAMLSLVTNLQWLTGATSTTAFGFSSWNEERIGGLGDAVRAAGPFKDDPNAYALYLVVMIGAAYGLISAARAASASGSPGMPSRLLANAIVRRGAWIAIASMVLAMAHTASRGGMLALVAVAACALVARGLDRRALGFAAIAVAVVVLGPFGVGDRLSSLDATSSLGDRSAIVDNGLTGRASEMLAAFDMFVDHPVAGVGYGTYNDRYLDYSRAIGLDGRFETRSAHSFPLEVAAEQGLIGLAAWAIFTGLAVVVASRLRRRHPDVGLAFGLALVGFAAASAFLHDLHPRLLWSLIGLVVAAAATVDRRPSPNGIVGSVNDDRIRVAMVIQSYVPAVGGAERQLANLMPAFVAAGIEPLVVTRAMVGRPRHDEIDGVPVERLPVAGPKLLRSMLYVAQARAALRRFDPHVVHSFDTLTPSTIAIGHASDTGCPVATKILRSGELGDLHRLAQKPFGWSRRRRLLHRVDTFVAISADIDDELHALGVAEDRIANIPNGVDTERFHPPRTRVRSAATASLRVIATGRLAPEKRLVELAEQWHRVTEQFPGTELAIVGEGPDAERLAEFDDVELYGRRDDVDELLRSADVYVSVSKAEGLSNALLEAMATGLPSVVTDVGGVADVIHTSNQGIIVGSDDIDGAVDVIIDLLGNDARRRSMRRSSRTRIRGGFSMDRTAGQLVEMYRRLAATHLRHEHVSVVDEVLQPAEIDEVDQVAEGATT